ncbi:Multidrug resistance-associated protein 1 [Dinochytrium kinnereticum]|nr:Multidrug resistance-associated protein 1 [Dinochytrium kinnereticum]
MVEKKGKDEKTTPTFLSVVVDEKPPQEAVSVSPPNTEVMEAKDPLTFFGLTYLNNMMKTSLKKPLEVEDIPLLKPGDRAAALSRCLEPFDQQVAEHLQAYPRPLDPAEQPTNPQPKPPSVAPFIFRTYGSYLYLGIFFQLISVAASLYLPFVLQAIILYIQKRDLPESLRQAVGSASGVPFADSGLGLCFLLFVVSLVNAVADPTYIQMIRNFQFNVQGVLRTAIFRKALKLSNASSKEFNEGRILSMVNVDTEQLSNAFFQLGSIISIPIQLILTIVFLVRLIGISIYPAAIVIFITLILTTGASSLFAKYMGAYMRAEDGRIKTLRELLMGIKIVKLRAAEDFQHAAVDKAREIQLSAMTKYLIAVSFLLLLADLPSSLMPIVSFLLYAKGNGGSIDPAVIFPALLYFSTLFQPMQALPQAIGAISAGAVALKRIEKFLVASERVETIHSSISSSKPADGDNDVVVIRNATVKWEVAPKEEEEGKKGKKKKEKKDTKDKKTKDVVEVKADTASEETVGKDSEEKEKVKISNEPFFKDLNLSINRGELTAVVGVVGSGKSSLISACLGEMTTVSGSISVNGKAALCQQQPWLLSQTVEKNILFGLPKDESRLATAVRSCGLIRDIEMMDNGLATEVGEKGITLSGGQKARLALARAVYDEADVYFLDDPLSALDAQVGKAVFDDCILGALAGKTRVLITHQLHILPRVDRIIVMAGGTVVEDGTYEVLMSEQTATGVLKELMKDYKTDQHSETNINTDSTDIVEPLKDEKSDTAERPSGPKGGNLIAVEDRQRGSLKFSVVKAYFKMAGGTPVVSVILLLFFFQTVGMVTRSLWLVWWSDRKFGIGNDAFLYGYAGVGAFSIISTVSCSWVITATGFLAGKQIHKDTMAGLLLAPMSFFDSQPIGRILNRLSKDIESIDRQIWMLLLNFFFALSMILSALVSLAYTTPYVLILFGLLLVVFSFFLQLYRSSSRELKRLTAVEKSPLNAHISECLSGIASLRAFKAEDRMIGDLLMYLDRSNKPLYAGMSVRVWLSIRIQLVTSLVILFVTIFGVLSTAIPASLMGLAITTSSELSVGLWVFVMFIAMLESEMIAVERLLEYCNNLPREAARELPTDPEKKAWPNAGAIEVKDLDVKYASMAEPVIKGLTLSIRPGEKIGIVGRTGSGKSTFLTALFRLVEPHAGSISIDGKDISKLGLKTLRERLQIIPQEPVLFTGTIRSNIDPESNYDDVKVWDALQMVGLKEFISSKEEKLEALVEENGGNLSVGQRQLLILARALCARPRILVMDEASSSVDAAADALIQSSIQSHFSDATVISIAHRLNTIADFDRVVVLDAGKMVEFDTPSNLLRNTGGHFRALVDATGPANAQLIQEIADDHERKVKHDTRQGDGYEKRVIMPEIGIEDGHQKEAVDAAAEARRGIMQARDPWSFVTVAYLNQLMRTSLKKPLDYDDIPMLKPQDRAETLVKCLDDYNDPKTDRTGARSLCKGSPIPLVLYRYGHYLAGGLTGQVFSIALSLYLPLVLEAILLRLRGEAMPAIGLPFPKSGLGLCFLLFGVAILKAIFDPMYIQLLRNFHFNVQSILLDAIFQKSLKLSNESSKKFDEGRILYMLNVDTQEIGQSVISVANVALLPIQIGLTLLLLSRLIGSAVIPAAIAVGCIFLTMIPVGSAFTKNMSTFMEAGDGRVKILSEALQGIRVVKMRNLESWVLDSVEKVRRLQLKALFSTIVISVTSLPPAVLPVVCVLLYSKATGAANDSIPSSEGRLTINPAIIFPALTYFGILFEPLEILPASIQGVSKAYVSLKRVMNFFSADERTPQNTLNAPSSSNIDQNISVKNSILIQGGSFRWIFSEKAENDIAYMEDVRSIASLKLEDLNVKSSFRLEDLNLVFPRGTLTAVIGRVGSGKSSLLSACLGDMTSTTGHIDVDGKVAFCQQQPWLLSQTIEENILFGNPKDVHRLNETIRCCGLQKDLDSLPNGLQTQIGERGMRLSGGQKARVALARAVYQDADIYLLDDPLSALDATVGQLVFEECVLKGLNGRTRVLVTHQLHVLPKVDQVVVLDGGKVAEVGTFAELINKDETSGVLRGMMRNYRPENDFTSTERGNEVLTARRLSTMDDSTALIAAEERETGSVKYNVVKEYYTMAGGAPAKKYIALSTLVASLISLAYSTPYILIFLAFLILVYGFFLKLYRASTRELRRILAIEKSPLYVHVSECLNGISTLRAFKVGSAVLLSPLRAEERAITKLRGLVDRSNTPLYAQLSVRVWLAVRLQFFSALVILFVSLFGTLTTSFPPSLMGLAISTASIMSSEISHFVILSAMLESELVAVERLLEYCYKIPTEAPLQLSNDPPLSQWPKTGDIVIENLSIKYDSSNEPAIENISICIKSGEKIGVVGRTGSGKSSFLMAIFRLVEPHSGCIRIDGKDISSIGLGTLRNGLQIVPQDPVLFSGTLRNNLDPHEIHDDSKLWKALDLVGMQEFVASQKLSLSMQVGANGSNLSVGQKQLITLARAICAEPKILILDEASSAVDTVTDAQIQKTIRTLFAKTTVISVAHRISSVADFDRVMVMEDGGIVELGTPASLLAIRDGYFRRLADASGP